MSVQCHMPPSHCINDTITGMHFGNTVYETHVKLGDTYCIVFDEPGILFCFPNPDNPAGFDPELPTGAFRKGCLPTVFTAVQEGDISIFFTSFDTFQTYLDILKVSEEYKEGVDTCPCA